MRLLEFTQLILAVGFTVASARLCWTAMSGRRNIRAFRYLGVIVTGGWAVYYYLVAVLPPSDVLHTIARTLQYFNLSMFLLWGFLFDEGRWEREAQERLNQLMEDDGAHT